MRPVHACWNICNKRPSGAFCLSGQPGPALLAVIFIISLLSCAFPPAMAKDAATINEEGATLLKNGDLQQALELFDQAIAADPTYSPARLNRGITLLSMNRPQEALLSLEVVLDRDPASVPAWIYRGDALMAMGKRGRQSIRTAQQNGLTPGIPSSRNGSPGQRGAWQEVPPPIPFSTQCCLHAYASWLYAPFSQ